MMMNTNHPTTNSQQFPGNSSAQDGLINFGKQPLFQNNNNIGELQEKMGIDHLLQLMSQVGVAIKAGDFSSQLAENIFTLCQQLKTYGQHLEQSHKNDLNKIFVSLRQACCRDNGQLGTPCRLKMMELVELRAMGWRPNYSHTQYYLNRPEQPANHPKETFASSNILHNPSSQTLNYCVPPPAPLLPQPNPQYVFMEPQTTPGYFLILGQNPANQVVNQGWSNPMVPAPFIPQSPHLQRAVMPAMDSDWQNRQLFMAQKQALMGSAPNSPLMGSMRHPMHNQMDPNNINTKSLKSQQFREEMTIRNADSGKIMGVKGRRVALVEELSKTVISFQKVEPKNKDRVLTITGNTQESIQQARQLIEETIRRNISPTRTPNDKSTDSTIVPNEEDDEEEDEDSPGISIQTSTDGTLKLCCADPEVLQAAQVALSDYLNQARRSTRMSAEERELRKERRKSMPLQSGADPALKNAVVEQPIQEVRRKFTGSTPNLMSDEGSEKRKEEKKEHSKKEQIRYDRAEMLSLKSQPIVDKEKLQAVLTTIQESMPEIQCENEE